MTRCSMRSTVVACGVTATRAGSRSIASASRVISCGMVAEKNSVCRSLRQHGDDALDVVDEAHVEHAVGFVEHEHLDLVETQRALVDEIEQAAGRGHQDFDAARQRTDLLVDRHAADGERDGERADVPAIGAEAVGDLAGQFARRREHQHAAGFLARAAGAWCAGDCRIGSAKAAVLPVPVCAMPMTSRPCSTSGMVWAWIGVGVTYFSSARARRIGSARPKSLNEVKESLFYMAKRPCCSMRAAESRGSKDIPRGQGCRSVWRNGRGGAKFVLKSFVHAARKPEIGCSSVAGHMTGADGLFKARSALIPPNDE